MEKISNCKYLQILHNVQEEAGCVKARFYTTLTRCKVFAKLCIHYGKTSQHGFILADLSRNQLISVIFSQSNLSRGSGRHKKVFSQGRFNARNAYCEL